MTQPMQNLKKRYDYRCCATRDLYAPIAGVESLVGIQKWDKQIHTCLKLQR